MEQMKKIVQEEYQKLKAEEMAKEPKGWWAWSAYILRHHSSLVVPVHTNGYAGEVDRVQVI